jgi:tetratricopeptide (TPR) repeat protein
MTITTSDEYRQMELDSSNFLLEWDAKRALGQYEEAAVAASRAGGLRLRMGQARAEAGDVVEAVEDWLSSGQAYLQATDLKQASLVTDHVKTLEAQGILPSSRTDLRKALREREEGLRHLDAAVRGLTTAFATHGFKPDVPDRASLDFLLRQVSELPGLAMLHSTIARQAKGLGQRQLASKHLHWATVFDPLNETFFAQLVHQAIEEGRIKVAQQLAEQFLSHNQKAEWVRLMLAIAFASDPETGRHELERAIEALQPLTDPSQPDALYRVAGLVVSLELRRALEQEHEAVALLRELDELERTGADPDLKATIAELRSAVSTLPNGARRSNSTGPQDEASNHRLLRLVEQLMTMPA